jgi:AcrR family transcriptional regulator
MSNHNVVMPSTSSAQTTPERLLDAALRSLEADGPEALKARELTRQIGVSTMAVYTHFGGMPGLVDAMVREGLGRFAAHVRARPPLPDEPLADLISGGLAYSEFALTNPQLYRLIFGLGAGAALRQAAPDFDAGSVWRLPEGEDAFSILLESVERVIEAGEFRRQDARVAAVQVLGTTHGYLLLTIGGFDEEERQRAIGPMAVNLMVGLGADRERTERALARAIEVRAWPGGEPPAGLDAA